MLSVTFGKEISIPSQGTPLDLKFASYSMLSAAWGGSLGKEER